jgi:hypothetical protein
MILRAVQKGLQQGRRAFGARSVQAVREHDQGPRTPLEVFLNSPFKNFWEWAEPRPPQEFLQTIGARGDDM